MTYGSIAFGNGEKYRCCFDRLRGTYTLYLRTSSNSFSLQRTSSIVFGRQALIPCIYFQLPRFSLRDIGWTERNNPINRCPPYQSWAAAYGGSEHVSERRDTVAAPHRTEGSSIGKKSGVRALSTSALYPVRFRRQVPRSRSSVDRGKKLADRGAGVVFSARCVVKENRWFVLCEHAVTFRFGCLSSTKEIPPKPSTKNIPPKPQIKLL